MKNDFRGTREDGSPVLISVLPTLLVTAIGHVEDVAKSSDTSFKFEGDSIYLVGEFGSGSLVSSTLSECFSIGNDDIVPALSLEGNLKTYKTLYQTIKKGLCRSVHDVSEGGILVSVVESMIGGEKGASLDFGNIKMNLHRFCFNEMSGRFIVSVAPAISIF